MSKEEYLKGEKKDKALDIIRYGLSTRCTNEEIIDLLKNKGICIAERTLRRFKSNLHNNSGDSAFDVFQNNVGNFILDDILAYDEMERQCWKIFNSTTNNIEKLKAISMLRLVTVEKFGILKFYPRLHHQSTCTNRLPRVKLDNSVQDMFSPSIDPLANYLNMN